MSTTHTAVSGGTAPGHLNLETVLDNPKGLWKMEYEVSAEMTRIVHHGLLHVVHWGTAGVVFRLGLMKVYCSNCFISSRMEALALKLIQRQEEKHLTGSKQMQRVVVVAMRNITAR